jgi:DNA-binding CsgD family transcriptional regulator
MLAEALWRAGRFEEAKRHLDEYDAGARAARRASALLGVARVRGQLVADTVNAVSALGCFEAASPLLDTLRLPLEIARFQMAHGQVLARAGRREQAIATLGAARASLAAMDATPYLERADQALGRLGHRAPRRSRKAEMTATEAVVARLVASGLSNKQVAERLVISPKGVEYHLANVYSKLGVRSRAQLASALAT